MRTVVIPAFSALVLLSVGGCAQMDDMFGGQQAAQPVSERSLASVDRLRPTEMVGMEVLAYNGETVGDVEDVLMESSGGKPSHLVVGSGGFLGMGGRQVALDIDTVRYARDRNAIVATNLTPEQFAAMPTFDYGEGMVSLGRSRTAQ